MYLVFDLIGCGIGERFLVVFEMHSFQLESKPGDVQKNLKLIIFSPNGLHFSQNFKRPVLRLKIYVI